MSEMLELALEYSRHGFHVFPLSPRSKMPLIDSKGFYDASRDEMVIRDWLGQGNNNVAIRTGSCSGVFVYDEDMHDGKEGPASTAKLEEEYGPLPPTLTQKTGSGGRHLFYRLPDGVSVKSRNGFRPGIDIKAEKGYVVAPPSIHPCGEKYEWVTPLDTPIAEAPDWLIRLVTERSRPRKLGLVPQGKIGEGGRNSFLTSHAGSMRRKGMSQESIEAALLEENIARCDPPLEEEEVRKIGHSISKTYIPDAGESALIEAQARVSALQEITPEVVFKHKFLVDLAVLKKFDNGRYAAFLAQCKGKINTNDLRAAVSQTPIPSSEENVDDLNLPVPWLEIPAGWKLTKAGVYRLTDKGDIKTTTTPIILVGRAVGMDNGLVKIKLAWLVGDSWREITVSRAVAMDARKLVQIADYGFPVSSENSRGIVQWISALEGCNHLPTVKTVSQLGWHKGSFAPVDNIEVDAGEGTASYAGAYTKQGSEDVWCEKAAAIRQHPLVRMAMAASFAAPLLELVGGRIFILHLWGPSRSGKSAALHAALSVWGNPEELVATFNATKVALERLASFYRDLPLGIDERQLATDKLNFLDIVTYMIGSGKGRLRGSKTGLQDGRSWRTVAITTGEEPISGDSSPAGVKTRTLEINGSPFPDVSEAREVYHWTKENHGHAGAVYIAALKQMSREDLRHQVREFREQINSNWPELADSHMDAMAMLALADMLASIHVFGQTLEAAKASAAQLIEATAGFLESAAEISDASRCQEFVEGWIVENLEHFGIDSPTHWGGASPDQRTLYVLKHVLDGALQKKGFPPRKLIPELAEIGYVRSFSGGGKQRYTTQHFLAGGRPMCYAIVRQKAGYD